MNFSALKKMKFSKGARPLSEPMDPTKAARALVRRKKMASRSVKTLLSVLIDQDYILCALQTFDGGPGRVTAVREFGMELSSEETPLPVALYALLSEFIGAKHSIDAAFLYLGEGLAEAHKVVADGMNREDVLASIGNESFWPNMVATSREIEDQAVCFELFNPDGLASSSVGVEAVFLEGRILADLEKAMSGLKLQCLSIAPLGAAISGCLLDGSGLDAVGLDIRSDGRCLVYSSRAGRCIPEEVFLPVASSNIKPFNPAASSSSAESPDGALHLIWGMAQFKGREPGAVAYCAPKDFNLDALRGSSDQTLERFDARIDRSEIDEQITRVSSERRVAEVIFMTQYTQLLSSVLPGDPLRNSDLNFRSKSWDLFDGDRRKSALHRSLLLSGALGVASAFGITAAAGIFLLDYRQIALDNEQVKSELSALDIDIMAVRRELEMLSLREEAIAQISGNHRDVYAALISVLGLVPHQVQLSRVSVEGETGNFTIEGVGANEIVVSNFVGLLSGGGRARASLLRISVNDEAGFSFEISVPFADLL